ncbi:organomercurial transporter MerC [Rhodanobacter sp. B2A1Ga4]|uniref:organomercurial transporter MerC n=1 Tax=Rhodanobacter sp. B2A1Ga4 TaxID=2778647 RepID=UPI001B381773|nr:organomercurial transporter MerC [Rhodanobacter sp. B2A1Ga4]MBQ4855801.1 organomercurial transporter MerC [Rhodanobacter sp. B2A1Ga4]
MSLPNPLTRTADKAGVIGAIVTAMGCAACFPALASLGAAIGLGFLSQYEGVFIRYLLPLFAVLALLANVIGGLRHRQWPRMILGMIGPVLVLAAALLMSTMGLPTAWLLYPGLVLMVAVSIWDLVSPPGKSHGGASRDRTCC